MGPQTFEDSVVQIIATYGVAFMVFLTPIILTLFAREAIANRIGGWWFKRKGYYHEDQYVKVDGQFGYIAYIGNYETKFYIYEINAGGEICGKWGLKILNNELREHSIQVLVSGASIPKSPKNLYA